MECRVEYDYAAQEEDELSLKRGDIISNVVQKMDGWWEGTLRGKTGMFPDNFVKVVEKSSSSTAPVEPVTLKTEAGNSTVTLRSNPSKSARRLKALFSYSPEQEDELRLEIGDIVEFMTEVEEGWWRGKLKGRVGIFPSNFVSDYEPTSNGKIEPEPKQNDVVTSSRMNHPKEEPDVVPPPPASAPPVEDEPAPELPPKPVRELARCFYPYQAQNEDELGLVEGDIVTIISKNCEDDGWWRGEIKGKTGLFPDNFVKIIPANEIAHQSKTPSITSHTTKISPQGRNLVGVKPIGNGAADSNITEKTNGSTVVDGTGSSKLQEKEKESVSSKVALFSKHPINFNPSIKPTTPTSPVSSGSLSPLSMPTVLKSDMKKDNQVTKNGKRTEEMGDFNAIERGEKLNHLTVGRAKAPKRRPPSTVISRDAESDESLLNGSLQSEDSMDSPPVNHSTPFNSTANSTISIGGTPSASVMETSSISGSGSFLAQNKEDSSLSPASGSSSASVTKPKKLLPWMAELKQKQDKKHGATSPGTVSNTSNVTSAVSPTSTGSPSSLPPVSSIVTKEKEPAPPPAVLTKAPPLPAKPSTLSTSASVDKSSGISPSTAAVPAAAPSVMNRGYGRKPAPANPIQNLTNNHLNSTGHDSNAGGDTKHFVSYEEYAKLRDRVSILETELETVRRQVKLLLDRELNHGHIV